MINIFEHTDFIQAIHQGCPIQPYADYLIEQNSEDVDLLLNLKPTPNLKQLVRVCNVLFSQSIDQLTKQQEDLLPVLTDSLILHYKQKPNNNAVLKLFPDYEPTNELIDANNRFWDQVRDQIYHQVRDQFWKVRAQVRDQIYHQIRHQVRDQVRIQVYHQIWDHVRIQIAVQVLNQAWTQVCVLIFNGFGEKIGNLDYLDLPLTVFMTNNKFKTFQL